MPKTARHRLDAVAGRDHAGEHGIERNSPTGQHRGCSSHGKQQSGPRKRGRAPLYGWRKTCRHHPLRRDNRERLNQQQPECLVKKSVRVGIRTIRRRSTEKLPLGALFGKALEALAQLSKALHLREEPRGLAQAFRNSLQRGA